MNFWQIGLHSSLRQTHRQLPTVSRYASKPLCWVDKCLDMFCQAGRGQPGPVLIRQSESVVLVHS